MGAKEPGSTRPINRLSSSHLRATRIRIGQKPRLIGVVIHFFACVDKMLLFDFLAYSIDLKTWAISTPLFRTYTANLIAQSFQKTL